MLERALEFINKVPEYMVKNFGTIKYEELAFREHKSEKQKRVVKIVVLIGLILLVIKLYRRFRNK